MSQETQADINVYHFLNYVHISYKCYEKAVGVKIVQER